MPFLTLDILNFSVLSLEYCRYNLKQLALLFLKLGAIGFGGPAAHIAMMEEEVVKKRAWLTQEHFLDLLGLTNLIPGPNSTEMAIHIGYVRGGRKGLFLAGACFIAPAVTATLLLAYLYVHFGTLPQFGWFMVGIRPAVVAVILGAVYRLGKPVVQRPFMVLVGIAVMVLNILHVDEVALLLGGGAAGLLWSNRNRIGVQLSSLAAMNVTLGVPAFIFSGAASSAATGGATVAGMGLFFLKIGSVLYGSGYVLVSFLQGGLVDARHWLTQTQLLDAIAIGQFTPGPVLSTATFIGYLILGYPGALVATTGIFLPSFIFVLVTAPLLPRIKNSPTMKGFLDGVNSASLGLMASVCFMLASSLAGFAAWIILSAALLLIVMRNVSAAWIIIGAGVAGWLLSVLPT